MNVKCKCGGKFRRSDIVKDIETSLKYGRTMYKDLDPLVAHWRCDCCGETREQRKRQPETLIERTARKKKQREVAVVKL